MIHDFVDDIRCGLRQFARTPALTVVAVLTLAVGIGATTAIFSLLDAATLQQLPVSHPEQLRIAVVTSPDGATMSNVPSAFFDQLHEAPSSFSGVFAFYRTTMNVDTGGDVDRMPIQLVSGGYYATLGIAPFAGRLIDEADDQNRRHVAVLSHAFWVRRCGGDPSALGRSLNVDGVATTIVGITPPGFFGTDRGVSPDITIPLSSARRLANLWVTVRLRPEVSDKRASADANLALRRALEEIRPALENYRPSDRENILGERAGLVPGGNGLGVAMHPYVDSLRVLMLLAGVVLLIACVNIANLLLARSVARSSEIAVRLALGASRGRLVRQLLVENAMLSAAGAAAGIALAFWMHRVLVWLLMDEAAGRTLAFDLNAHVLAFSAVATMATLLLFGLAPALRATDVDGGSLLQRSAPANRRASLGLLKGLIVVQVSSAVVLLFGAGLLARTFQNLGALDTGVPVRNLLMMRLGFGSQRGLQASHMSDFYDLVSERVGTIPGVESVAFGWDFAFGTGTASKSVWVEGQPPDKNQSAGFNAVGPGFFTTAGIPVVAGREFSRRDDLSASKVVIVNDAFARRYFPGQNPIGRHVGDEGAGSVFKYEIIGVVRDTRNMFLRKPAAPVLYQSLLQDTYVSNAVLHVRTREDARRVQDRVRAELRSVDPTLPVYDVTTLEARRSDAVRNDRMMATLSGFFGVFALLLTMIGVYGVIAYVTGRRTVEIGVRMALGASSGQVRRMVLRETLWVMAIGAAIGLPLSFASARVLNTMLFGVTPQDPATAIICALMLLLAGAASGYLPARRAASVEPMTALRSE